MTADLTRRTYDLLRLVDDEEPIGSIRLVELMQRRGYSIKGRTIRVTLSELDGAGLTEKVPGKGRRLTEAGRAELARGNVSGRLERIRERISTLTSQVTYDPIEDAGALVTSSATVPEADLAAALDSLERVDDSPLGPILVSVEPRAGGTYRLSVPSSITLDGVLLAHGIDVDLVTAGLVEYAAESTDEAGDPTEHGGRIARYVDAISGEGSTVDVVSLLIEAGRTDVSSVASSGSGLLVADNRELPLTRYGEAADLSTATRDRLGGVLDLRRPREPGPFPAGEPGWDFASLTYGGAGELAVALLAENDAAEEWETLSGLSPRSTLSGVREARAESRE